MSPTGYILIAIILLVFCWPLWPLWPVGLLVLARGLWPPKSAEKKYVSEYIQVSNNRN